VNIMHALGFREAVVVFGEKDQKLFFQRAELRPRGSETLRVIRSCPLSGYEIIECIFHQPVAGLLFDCILPFLNLGWIIRILPLDGELASCFPGFFAGRDSQPCLADVEVLATRAAPKFVWCCEFASRSVTVDDDFDFRS